MEDPRRQSPSVPLPLGSKNENPRCQSGLDEFQVPAVRHGRREPACAGRSSGSARRRAAAWWRSAAGGGRRARVPDHAEAVRQCLAQLTDPKTAASEDAAEVSAIAFKAVHGGRMSGVQRVTADVLAAMDGDEPGGPGPQSAVHRRHAAAGRAIARDSAGGGLRNRFPPHHSRPQPLLRRAATSGPRTG